MKMNNVLRLLMLALIFAACGDEPAQRNTSRPSQNKKAMIKVAFDKKGTVAYGSDIAVNVSLIDTSLQIERLEISQPGMSFKKEFQEGAFNLSTTETGGGNVRLKFVAYLSNGEKSTRYKEFLVVSNNAPKTYDLIAVNKYPHDPSSFTQGFLIHDNALYEGTGNFGETRIRKIDLSTGKVLQQKDLESDIFGEGITIMNDKIYQLTYKSSRGFVYDLESFERLDEHIYNTHTSEGWGLSNNDSALIATDGSHFIYYLDPADFSEMKRLAVFDNRGEVEYLNELEYHDGYLYANIYTTAKIVKIDPTTGEILEEYTARGIVQEDEVTPNMDVLNGITFNPGTGKMLITGKYWSKIYEVNLKPTN